MDAKLSLSDVPAPSELQSVSRKAPLVTSVAAALITGGEVNTLRVALKNPTEKPDPWGPAGYVLTTIAVFAKTLAAGPLGVWDYLLLGAMTGVCAVMVAHYVAVRRRRYPFHALADGIVAAIEAHIAHGDLAPVPEPELEDTPPKKG